jgi:hypothetical protein
MSETKIYNWHNFRDYLKPIANTKGFDCSRLRVLSEDVQVELEGDVKTYERGSFICISRLGSDGDARCISYLTLNNERLEVLCGWDEKSRFVLKNDIN